MISMSLGIVYSDDKATLYAGEKIEIEEISADGNVQVLLNNLKACSIYYFCTYFEQNGNYS